MLLANINVMATPKATIEHTSSLEDIGQDWFWCTELGLGHQTSLDLTLVPAHLYKRNVGAKREKKVRSKKRNKWPKESMNFDGS